MSESKLIAEEAWCCWLHDAQFIHENWCVRNSKMMGLDEWKCVPITDDLAVENGEHQKRIFLDLRANKIHYSCIRQGLFAPADNVRFLYKIHGLKAPHWFTTEYDGKIKPDDVAAATDAKIECKCFTTPEASIVKLSDQIAREWAAYSDKSTATSSHAVKDTNDRKAIFRDLRVHEVPLEEIKANLFDHAGAVVCFYAAQDIPIPLWFVKKYAAQISG